MLLEIDNQRTKFIGKGQNQQTGKKRRQIKIIKLP